MTQATTPQPTDSAAAPGVTSFQLSRNDAMTRALEFYRAGNLAEAVRYFEAVLASNAGDADALHMLGVAHDAQGQPALGVQLIRQALSIKVKPSFLSNYGMVLGHLGRHAEALEAYEQALAEQPDYPEALNNKGVSLEALRRSAEAVEAYRLAVQYRPDYPEALGNLGNSLRNLGRMAEAVAAYEQAVSINPTGSRAPLGHALRALGRKDAAREAFEADVARNPNNPEALNNLAAALGEVGETNAAAELLPRVTELRPNYPEAHANLGHVLGQLNRLEDAVAACKRALELRPDYPEALTNLANSLRALGRLDEAEAAARRALALRTSDINAYNNLAITLQAQNRPVEALAVLDLAVAIDPNDAESHHHRAMLLLREGRFIEGWVEYEWRFRTKQAGEAYTQFLTMRAWQGEDISGKTILIVPEQGLGDTLQFVRYVPMLKARGVGRVILGVQSQLSRLLRSLNAEFETAPVGSTVTDYDLHCTLLSLPRAFGTTVETIPANIPYLHAEPEAVARWATRLGADKPGFRVGIVWAGNPKHMGDRHRSIAFTTLVPLWQVPGVRWFSLQVGERSADLATAAEFLPADGIDDLAPELTDFAETAAAMQNLDLVIAVDTSVLHLAGAIGRPVWALIAGAPDWRWLNGEGSPWYPTMRLFRQQHLAQWQPVMEAVSQALSDAAAG